MHILHIHEHALSQWDTPSHSGTHPPTLGHSLPHWGTHPILGNTLPHWEHLPTLGHTLPHCGTPFHTGANRSSLEHTLHTREHPSIQAAPSHSVAHAPTLGNIPYVGHAQLQQYGFRMRLIFPSYFGLFLLRASSDQN